MPTITSRESVQAALAREPVDRVAIVMWFRPQTTRRLAAMLSVPEAFVGDAMGNHIYQTWANNNDPMEGIVNERAGDSRVDSWGIEWTYQYGYNQTTRYPLAEASRDEVLGQEFPYAEKGRLIEPMDSLSLPSEGFFLGRDESPCAFEMAWRLLGIERTLIAMASDRADAIRQSLHETRAHAEPRQHALPHRDTEDLNDRANGRHR